MATSSELDLTRATFLMLGSPPLLDGPDFYFQHRNAKEFQWNLAMELFLQRSFFLFEAFRPLWPKAERCFGPKTLKRAFLALKATFTYICTTEPLLLIQQDKS